MSWLGVPFVTREDWYGFPWARKEFFNQFVHAAQHRIDVMRQLGGQAPVTLGLFEGGAPAQPATFFNNFRRFGNYKVSAEPLDRNPAFATLGARPLTAATGGRWIDKAKVHNGSPFGAPTILEGVFPSSFFLFDNAGLATEALLVRMNEELENAGCPPLQTTTPNASANCMGIPWTRKYGEPGEEPTVETGECEDQDWIGPWIFNELWALLKVLDAVHLPVTYMQSADDGSEETYRQMRWVTFQSEVSNACGTLGGAPDSDETTTRAVLNFYFVQSAARDLWPDGSTNKTIRGYSDAKENKLVLAKPNAEHGLTLLVWSQSRGVGSSGSEYVDFADAIQEPGKICLLATYADGAGNFEYTVGGTENLLGDLPTCVNPGGDDPSLTTYSQGMNIGFAALECAFPDPPH